MSLQSEQTFEPEALIESIPAANVPAFVHEMIYRRTLHEMIARLNESASSNDNLRREKATRALFKLGFC